MSSHEVALLRMLEYERTELDAWLGTSTDAEGPPAPDRPHASAQRRGEVPA